MLEEDSRLSYTRKDSSPDSNLETMSRIQQASRNNMVVSHTIYPNNIWKQN